MSSCCVIYISLLSHYLPLACKAFEIVIFFGRKIKDKLKHTNYLVYDKSSKVKDMFLYKQFGEEQYPSLFQQYKCYPISKHF